MGTYLWQKVCQSPLKSTVALDAIIAHSIQFNYRTLKAIGVIGTSKPSGAWRTCPFSDESCKCALFTINNQKCTGKLTSKIMCKLYNTLKRRSYFV